MSSPPSSKVVLCTGANQGLGSKILHVTAINEPSAIYILACRKVASGYEAVERLKGLGLNSNVEVLQLDVTNDKHVAVAANYVKTSFGKLDGK